MSASSGSALAPFYIDDLDALREKLARAERDGTSLGQLWSAVRRRGRSAPQDFPWFTPFLALISGEKQDADAACQVIRGYLRSLDVQPFGSGLQFHFWCFAFPHARWGLYFQWLQSIGAWSPEEEQELAQEILIQQFTNFFFGMRVKPEPECVDNQSMSLCFSNALLGQLFSQPPIQSAMARRMMDDGLRRLPGMIGGMPASGYSGEGSTYMDGVVGPAIPFLVELLERTQGGDWFDRPLEPAGGSASAICRMIAREWMPGGLLLPWDHYGYQLPVRASIAYAARRTNDPFYFELLEQHASFAHDSQVGWGFDDLIWTLIWWPDHAPKATAKAFSSWVEPELGAAIVSSDASLYLMQMWDESEPVYPSRAHVNPNAVVLNAYGVPLTVDGVVAADCTVFNFEDTWREVSYMDLNSRKFNYGSGCAGSHSVLFVDGWEGMRAVEKYEQARLLEFDETSVTTEVTPIYRERWPGAQRVLRRSQLCHDRFWLIEDLAQFDEEHEITSRWWLRPSLIQEGNGLTIETAEGIRLQFLPLVGSGEKRVAEIKGYPDRLDGSSLRVDWLQTGTEARWLWLVWPENTRVETEDVSANWQVIADPAKAFGSHAARQYLDTSEFRLAFTAPADMLADIPLSPRWWYRKTIRVPDAGIWWLRLPRQMFGARLWVNGQEVDLSAHKLRSALLEPHVQMPAGLNPGSDVEVLVRTDVSTRQYEGQDRYGGTGFSGRPAILVPRQVAPVNASYTDGRVTVQAGDQTFGVEYALLTGEEALARA